MAADFQLSPVQKPSQVAFGSGVQRKLFPTDHPPTRFGIEQKLRGEPNRGPGYNSPHPVSLFLQSLDSVPRSKRGWYFGATTSTRVPKPRKGTKPGPADYQEVIDQPAMAADSYKPFGSASDRLPGDDKSKDLPGPGVYERGVTSNRHVDFSESFGSGRVLKDTVTVKCTNGIPDQCQKCKLTQTGDYYENSNYTLCPQCYREMKCEEKNRLQLVGFHKVRDCRTIHKHNFPGKEPKVLLMSEKEQKRLRYREAYMRVYYS